jgi:hypothetical protein
MLRRRAAWRFATDFTAHHGSFLPCSPVPLRCQRRCAGVCRPKEVTPAAPPNTCCSRSPSRCDFPPRRVPSAGGGLHRRSHRVAAELLRWAGGSRCLLLQSVCSARASAGNAPEPPCPSHNRVRHLRSSARPRVPASHRVHLTHVAYASPSLGLALRLWLHGSARRFLPCVSVWKAMPTSLHLVCADREASTPAAPPNTRCSRPPSRCDFSSWPVPTARGGSHRCTRRAAG